MIYKEVLPPNHLRYCKNIHGFISTHTLGLLASRLAACRGVSLEPSRSFLAMDFSDLLSLDSGQ